MAPPGAVLQRQLGVSRGTIEMWNGIRRGLLAVAASLGFASVVGAAETPTPTAPPPAQATASVATPTAPVTPHELTATDVETFFDGIIPLQHVMDDIGGATVAIVKDGKLLFAKGYGFSDVKARKPVVAE